ncbi:TAXI family TRAP transporter solute-binding subunit [Alkalihalobacillus deserti]|uniref:TAXI family TRAP transporter solute-binding subunit n=1 Tax=Alkalihalobacillus deserti TaxID=2879466 RepID=UPI001D1505B5|nr:TAXI family TRAP transporter solute-binding subunit [Alkalihalobacillus deserti]
MKHVHVGLVFLFLVSLVLVGCGNGNLSQPTNDENKTEGSFSGIIPVYTPGSGGINYIISAGLANILNNEQVIPGASFATEATNGTSEIVQYMSERHEQGRPAFGGIGSIGADQAFNGVLDPVPGEHDYLRGVGFLSYNALHLVVLEKSPIHSFKDLAGKRIGVAAIGTPPTELLEDLMEAHGVSKDNYQLLPLSSFTEIQEAILNGSVDAGYLMGAIPAPTVREIAQTEDVRIIPVEPSIMADFVAQQPYYSSVDIAAGTYKGQDEDISIGAFYSIYITHEKTDDEMVYKFLETIMENAEGLKEIHPTFDIVPETVVEGVTIPYHPGALQYFEDHGIEIQQ